MTLLKSLLDKPIPRQLQADPIDAIFRRLGTYSRFGIILAVLWFVVNRPFWRHLFVALCAMAFATLMLPAKMMFFVRHAVLAFAVPFAAGLVAANLSRSGIGTVAARPVLIALAVGAYRTAADDPVTGEGRKNPVPSWEWRKSRTVDPRRVRARYIFG